MVHYRDGNRIELKITRTGRPNSKEEFQIFDTETKIFGNLKEAKAWLKEQYGKHKKDAQYIDTKKGAKQVGYVYHLGWQRDWSHSDPTKWLQEDWVSFSTVKDLAIGVIK